MTSKPLPEHRIRDQRTRHGEKTGWVDCTCTARVSAAPDRVAFEDEWEPLQRAWLAHRAEHKARPASTRTLADGPREVFRVRAQPAVCMGIRRRG